VAYLILVTRTVTHNNKHHGHVKYWGTTITILAVLFASLALAEDFKTIKGKEYKDATIIRVEADGIVLRAKTGISKVYFIELSKEVQERFHYSPATPIAAHYESRPIKSEAKQDAPRQANHRGWVAAMMADPGTFVRVLRIFVPVTVIIACLVFTIVRRRSQ
jgi:hypothetical protein